MSGFLFFTLFAVVVFLAARSAVAKIQEAVKSAVVPPPLPRRGGRGRSARPVPKAVAEPEEEARAPAAASVPTERIVVTRPARASVHFDFKGKAALRRAMVAREVLGPPLALRPPRF